MITELQTFITVCRHGTFAAAGERIGLTQSAVSSQIKRLEETLGFELFDRTGRSATLNAAGETTLARAEEICSLYAKLGELPDDATNRGLLRIGTLHPPSRRWWHGRLRNCARVFLCSASMYRPACPCG